jgi:hypothetical protein
VCDRDLILLVAGAAIGMTSAILTLFVLGLFEHWLACRGDEMPGHQEIGFWVPSRSMERRWNMYGVVILVVFILATFHGLIAIRDLLGW